MVLNHLPEPPDIGVGWNAFEDHLGCTRGQGAIGNVGVSRYPANVGGTPENIVWANVKGKLHGKNGMQQVARRGVLNALGLAG